MVKLLLRWYEIDVEAKDKVGWTPLGWTAGKGYEAVVKLLLEMGKDDIEARDTEDG